PEPELLGDIDDAHAASAEQRIEPEAGDLSADSRIRAHSLRCRGIMRRLRRNPQWRHGGKTAAYDRTSARAATRRGSYRPDAGGPLDLPLPAQGLRGNQSSAQSAAAVSVRV